MNPTRTVLYGMLLAGSIAAAIATKPKPIIPSEIPESPGAVHKVPKAPVAPLVELVKKHPDAPRWVTLSSEPHPPIEYEKNVTLTDQGVSIHMSVVDRYPYGKAGKQDFLDVSIFSYYSTGDLRDVRSFIGSTQIDPDAGQIRFVDYGLDGKLDLTVGIGTASSAEIRYERYRAAAKAYVRVVKELTDHLNGSYENGNK